MVQLPEGSCRWFDGPIHDLCTHPLRAVPPAFALAGDFSGGAASSRIWMGSRGKCVVSYRKNLIQQTNVCPTGNPDLLIRRRPPNPNLGVTLCLRGRPLPHLRAHNGLDSTERGRFLRPCLQPRASLMNRPEIDRGMINTNAVLAGLGARTDKARNAGPPTRVLPFKLGRFHHPPIS